MKRIRIAAVLGIAMLACGGGTVRGQSTDARKLAALNQALKSGVISREEYNVKVAQLTGGSVDPSKKAALDDALKNGVLTQQEYDTKLETLKAALATAPANVPVPVLANKPASMAGADSISGGKKTVAVVDSVLNMPAFRVTFPSDWTFDGAVLRSACGDGLPFLVYRAYSPDKLSGIQIIPQADWYYATDQRVYKASGVSPCNLHAPARAADVAAKIATDLRSGAKVMDMPPLTPIQTENFQKAKDQGRAQMEQMNRQFPPSFQGTWDLDVQRVRISYDFEGHPVEEMITVRLTTWGRPVSVFGTGANGIIQPGSGRLTHTLVNVTTIRAPAGKLEALITALERDSSVEMVPEWNDAEIALIKKQGAEVMAIIQKNGQMLRGQADQFAQNMQRSND